MYPRYCHSALCMRMSNSTENTLIRNVFEFIQLLHHARDFCCIPACFSPSYNHWTLSYLTVWHIYCLSLLSSRNLELKKSDFIINCSNQKHETLWSKGHLLRWWDNVEGEIVFLLKHNVFFRHFFKKAANFKKTWLKEENKSWQHF